jgi:hypothetical protein
MHTDIFVGNLKGRDKVGGLGADGRITLRWILRKHGVRIGLNSSDS